MKPNVKPIRGGTDGAQLSFKVCHVRISFYTGGLNFHGRYGLFLFRGENMEKAE